MFTSRQVDGSAHPVRVALVVSNQDVAGQGSPVVNPLVDFLRRENVPVCVFTPHTEDVKPSVVDATPVSPGLVVRELRRFQPTVVHLFTADLLAFAALRWARFRNIPVIATHREHFTEWLTSNRLAFLEPLAWQAFRWAYSRCAEVHVPSSVVANTLRQQGIPTEIVQTPRGVNPEVFHPEQRSAVWRQSMGFADDELAVVVSGNVAWENGLALFAAVLSTLRTNGAQTRALVLGGGADVERVCVILPDAIVVEPQSNEERAITLASSDVFVSPGPDGASQTTLEAMACGLPVVITDAPGVGDLVRNGVDGLVCPFGRREGLELVLSRLTENSTARANLGRAATRRAEQYHWNTVLRSVLASYTRLGWSTLVP